MNYEYFDQHNPGPTQAVYRNPQSTHPSGTTQPGDRLLLPPPVLAACLALCACWLGFNRRPIGLCRVRVKLAQNTVADPVLVPPLARVDLHAVYLHAEVYMNAQRQAGCARHAETLVLLDHIANLDVNMIQVPVDGLQRIPMIDNHAVSVDSQIAGPGHAAVIRNMNGRVLSVGKVEAKVHLVV